MQLKDNYKILSVILIFFSLSSFFLGFYLDENSAGAGGYSGDWVNLLPNIQLFLNNDILTAINHEDYYSNRSPLLYILQKIFNPFAGSAIEYRRSIFFISLAVPVLFYFCLKQKFKKEDNLLLLLTTSTIFLSPYYRTSSYWGLEENYGLICLFFSFLFLNLFLKNKNESNYIIYAQLFLLVFFSSLCVYFDLKLLIIPIICFLKIITSEKKIELKVFSIFSYFLFSLPYIYLIILWGGLFAPTVEGVRNFGKLYVGHLGYTATIIAFYFVPFLLFKGKDLFFLIKDFFFKRKNSYPILLFVIYIFYLLISSIFFDQNSLNIELSMGKGVAHKLSFILFKNNMIGREIFIYFSFLISWIIILMVIDNNIKDSLILLYFFLISVVTFPMMQEYFDPIILVMIFTFFNSKIFMSYKNTIILFCYLSVFLFISNIYYYNLIN